MSFFIKSSGIMQPAKLIQNGHGAVWLNEVMCSGSESKLLDCKFNNVTLQCDHWDDVGVHCFLNCSTEDEGMKDKHTFYAWLKFNEKCLE